MAAERDAAGDEARRQLELLLEEADRPESRRDLNLVYHAVQRLLWDQGGATNPRLLLAALEYLASAGPETSWYRRAAAQQLVGYRVIESVPSEPEVQAAIAERADVVSAGEWSRVTERVLECAQAVAGASGLTLPARRALARLRDNFDRGHPTHEKLRWVRRLDDLLRDRQRAPLDERDAWAGVINADLAELEAERAGRWVRLMTMGSEADAARPSKKWLADARAVVEGLGGEEFSGRVAAWLARVELPKSGKRGAMQPGPSQMQHANAGALRGLVWAASSCEGEPLARAVGDLCLKCFHKIPDWGPYSERLGSACIFSLGAMPGPAGLAQLARLRAQVKYSAGQRAVQKAYEAAAERAGVSVDVIAEHAVPSAGFADGLLTERVGDSTAEVRALGTGRAELCWRSPAGKVQKAVPADALRSDPEAVEKLKRLRRDVEADLQAQRSRLEGLFLKPRWIPCPAWLERYANQPLIGPMVRHLIWRVGTDDSSALGVFRDGVFVAPEGQVPPEVDASAGVQLWHPLDTDATVIEAWRRWLVEHEVTQPFKQAHREVYRLDAEADEADLHASRFSGHLLREHLLTAVCRERGWRYALEIAEPGRGPTLSLPAWGLSAELEVAPTGAWRDAYVTLITGDVRFAAAGGERACAGRVPTQVFSEILRDVDLFISVASIAGDPAVLEQGSADEKSYWSLQAYAELCVAAADRAAVLKGVLPRLIIGKRCRLEGVYLVVTGRLREYRIHLGSGNVLVDPGRVHLPLALPRGPSGWEAHLPFVGDSRLDEILGKAFLLANDTSIEEPAIREALRLLPGS